MSSADACLTILPACSAPCHASLLWFVGGATLMRRSLKHRLDNMVMDEAQPGRVLGVLDWELSTLGDPLADLAYLCMPYHLPQVRTQRSNPTCFVSRRSAKPARHRCCYVHRSAAPACCSGREHQLNCMQPAEAEALIDGLLLWTVDGTDASLLSFALIQVRTAQGIPTLPSLPQPLPAGVLSEEQLVVHYAAARGISVPDASVRAFFLALSLFRLAAICAGVGARARQGNASSRIAHQVENSACAVA